MTTTDSLLAPMPRAERRDMAGVQVDILRAGEGRIRRLIYQPGFRWSTHIKPSVGTDLCQHAHVGFLARGRIGVRFGDGCTREFTAPDAVVIEPGHDGWVIGDEPAVLVEFDFEAQTVRRFGLAERHRHGA